MNVSAKHHTLIIGIGNPLRSDDGLGWAVAEQLSHDHDAGSGTGCSVGCGADCAIHTVHQLTPELAQSIAAVNLVIIIDASHEGEPGELHIRPLSPLSSLSPLPPLTHTTQPGAIGTHHTTQPGAVGTHHTTQPGAVGTHHTTPAELAALTVAIYGHCPPVVLVTMTGADFSLGEHLSSTIAPSIPLLSAAVRQLCTHGPGSF